MDCNQFLNIRKSRSKSIKIYTKFDHNQFRCTENSIVINLEMQKKGIRINLHLQKSIRINLDQRKSRSKSINIYKKSIIIDLGL